MSPSLKSTSSRNITTYYNHIYIAVSDGDLLNLTSDLKEEKGKSQIRTLHTHTHQVVFLKIIFQLPSLIIIFHSYTVPHISETAKPRSDKYI